MTDVQVAAEPTPNPNSVKFTLNRTLTGGDAETYGSPQEAEDSPLARSLFGVQGVSMVFLLNNFITVSKEPGAEWRELVPEIERRIRDHFSGSGETA